MQEAHQRLGNKWAGIAKLLVGRSENAVKNRWHGSLRRNMMNVAAVAKCGPQAIPAAAAPKKPAKGSPQTFAVATPAVASSFAAETVGESSLVTMKASTEGANIW